MPEVAVCLLPGTELAFENDVRYEHKWIWTKRAGFKVARFRKIEQNVWHQHHDAIEFPDGSSVFVTLLSKGQRATVLQLPVGSRVSDRSPQAAKSLGKANEDTQASAV